MSKPLIKPHTRAWFADLTRRADADSIRLGVFAARNIKHYKSKEICSVCGDTPSKEMKFDTLTLRLCDDCHGIRAFIHQQLFMPIEPGDYIES